MNYDYQQHETYFLRAQTGTRQVAVKQILYVRAEGYTSFFHLADSPNLLSVAKLLKEVEADLSDLGFLRINRNTLLNMRFVVVHSGNQLLLSNGEKLPIAVRRRKTVRKFLSQSANKIPPP